MTEQKGVLKRALDAIDSLTAQLADSEARAREPIAVVGMSCRLPGGVNSPADYWSLLREGRSGISEIPADRWDVDAFYDPDPKAAGKMYTKHGGFLESVDTFDAPFFGIAPREAVTLDPQHRLLLECSWEALEDAGIAPDRLANSPTGVYVGITTSDYARLLRSTGNETDVYSASGTALNAAPGRISFALGLQGPSMAIDTACSSSLVAAHVAAQALRSGECDLALVGGVNVIVAPDAFVLFSKWGMISPSGQCRTFDAGADGFVRGEGCGVLVFKRMRDALADGNRVLAVIRGSAVNQDGPSSGLSVPNGLAQAKVIRRALRNAGVSAADVGYVEAHGTGTIIGDPIEVEALGEAYCADRTPDAPLLLGSVKSSIGHLESAAGVAGLMKLVLTVQHGEIPPQRNYDEPNPRIDWDRMPLRVADRFQPWPEGMKSRIGAVSGFGFSGTNAHMIVEAPPVQLMAPAARAAHVLPISARTDAALRESAGRLGAVLAAPGAPSLADAARTLSMGRAHLPHRAIIVGADRATVQARLADFARDEPTSGVKAGTVAERTAPRIAFLYTGQGAQYPGMGLELRESFPVFREAFDKCDAVLREHGGVALLDILRNGDASIHDTGVTQPALFALEYALTELVRSWGIIPSAVLGHSVGEFAAACVAGVLTVDEALRLIAERGRLMQSLPAGGGMLAVATDADTALAAAAPFRDRVSLAARNGPRDVVLSGDVHALAEIAEALRADGVDTKPLTVSHAFHSPLMDPILEPFGAFAAGFSYAPARLPLVSNLSGIVDATAGTSAAYWRRHVREPVNFEASMRHLIDDDYRVFLEIGPRPVLLGMARRFLTSGDIAWIPTMRARAGETVDVLESIGTLFTAGAQPDWERVLDGAGRPVPLPTYPFQRRRHWVEAPPAYAARIQEDPDDHPLLGRKVASPLRETLYECALDPVRRPVLREHCVAGSIIVPAAAYIEIGFAAAADVFGSRSVRLEGGYLRTALVLDDAAPRDVQLVVAPRDDGAATFEVFSRPAMSDEPWTSHAGGRIVRADAGALASMDAAHAHAVPIDIDAYQQRMKAVGLDYGPSFLALKSALRGNQEAWGELRLPEGDVLAPRLGVHPGLLDAAFHLIGIALPDDAQDRFYLPVGYETAEIAAAAGVDARAHVRLRSIDARRVLADICVWRSDGAPAVRVSGLEVRPVTREQFQAAIGIASTPPLLRVEWQPAPECPASAGAGVWLVVGGAAALAAGVEEQLRTAGWDVQLVCVGTPETAGVEISADNLNGARGIIDLRTTTLPLLGTDTAAPSELLQSSTFAGTLALLRSLAEHGSSRMRVVLPTVNAQAATAEDVVDPLATLVWGVAATAVAETGMDVRLVDLDDSSLAATAIVHAALRADGEDRLAARAGNLLVPRLATGISRVGALELPAGPYELAMVARGTLDGLGVEPKVRKRPGPGQVEIEVIASGLNFRDVLNLLDMYPGPAGPLGNECCGRIVAAGPDVNGLAVGDLVTCIAESTFASHVVADAAMTFRVPRELSAGQAAAFPIAQLTAYLALHHVGGMRPGDRVLIHAGAGGVGLAAVNLALAAGADVLASAGSEEKRACLRSLGVRVVFDSRNPASSAEIRAATDGHGIDLLLNSLTGDFIDQGLLSLAPGGRFLEIGLRELRTEDEVRALREDVSYHSLLLGQMCREDPDTVRSMYDALCVMLANGRIPAPRVRTFPVTESATAFRFMAKARHIGRVAITHPAAGQPRARRDASYLVTGGLGALGLRVAEWLSEEGAGHLVLMGRSAPSDAAARRIAALESNGTTVEIVRGDVAREDDFSFLTDTSRPPLRGVIHAAGIVDDAVLSRVDTERFARALRPKADGACNLIRATRGAALDFFVFFSSGSALLGSPGQTTYAGANAFLDGLAHRLRSEGRAAQSINWGAWSGGGMAAAVDERTTREWAGRGIGMLSMESGMASLEAALDSGLTQVAALPIDWSKFGSSISGAVHPLLSDVLKQAPDAHSETTPRGPDARQLAALEPEARRSAVTEFTISRMAAVLGFRSGELTSNTMIGTLGFDSLMAVELRNRIESDIGVLVPVANMLQCATAGELARLIDGLLENEHPAVSEPAVAYTEGEI